MTLFIPEAPTEEDFYSWDLDRLTSITVAIVARGMAEVVPWAVPYLIYYALNLATPYHSAEAVEEAVRVLTRAARNAFVDYLQAAPERDVRRCGYVWDVEEYRVHGGEKPVFDPELWTNGVTVEAKK